MTAQLEPIEVRRRPSTTIALSLLLAGFYLLWTLWAILLIHAKVLDAWPIRLAARLLIWGGFVWAYAALCSNPLREIRFTWRGVIWSLATSSFCIARLSWRCVHAHRQPTLPDFGTIANAVIVGPILEELVFRAAIFRELSTRLGVLPAAISSALLFAMIHVSYWLLAGQVSHAALMSSLGGVFLLGLVLAFIYRWSGTLLAPTILHALNNLTSLA